MPSLRNAKEPSAPLHTFLIFFLMWMPVVTSRAVMAQTASSPASTAGSPLEDTYWKLTQLGGQAINLKNARTEPHLVLDSKSHRLNGSAGCNQVVGTYEQKENSLSFAQLTSSMLPCPAGFDADSRFMTALREVKTWQVDGSTLDFRDAGGKLLAQFEAGTSK
jgi:heat shock protein HslJ